jgi:mono/diheme cytochrome c family protein
VRRKTGRFRLAPAAMPNSEFRVMLAKRGSRVPAPTEARRPALKCKSRPSASKTDMMKQWMSAAGAMLLAAAWCGHGPGLSVARAAETAAPTSPADAPTDAAAKIARGKTLFVSYGCGYCHEDGGRKAGKCPQLMDTQRDDNFIVSRIATGSEGKMPAFGTVLAGPDVFTLLTYIRSLKPETKP